MASQEAVTSTTPTDVPYNFKLAAIGRDGHERGMDASDAGDAGGGVDGAQSADGADALRDSEGRRREVRRCRIASGREVSGGSLRYAAHSWTEIYAPPHTQSLGRHQIGKFLLLRI